MIEFQGACGSKVSVNPVHVEYAQETEYMGSHCPLLCFHSGKKIFVRELYADVVKAIEQAVDEK